MELVRYWVMNAKLTTSDSYVAAWSSYITFPVRVWVVIMVWDVTNVKHRQASREANMRFKMNARNTGSVDALYSSSRSVAKQVLR